MFNFIRSKRLEIEIWQIFDLYGEKHLQTLSHHRIIAYILP